MVDVLLPMNTCHIIIMRTTNAIAAFDKVQDLQWDSDSLWREDEYSPLDAFKDLIRDKRWGARELHQIGEALLVFENFSKDRVETYIETLEEIGA